MSDHQEERGGAVVEVSLGTIYETLINLDKKMDPIPATVADHEGRIRKLEMFMYGFPAALIVGVIGFFIKLH